MARGMSSSRDSADQQGQRLKKARSSSYLGSCKAQQLLQEQAWLALLSGYIPRSPHRLIELKREKERKRRKMRERLNNAGGVYRRNSQLPKAKLPSPVC